MDKVRRLGRNASVEASSEQGPKELLLAHSHAQAMPNTGSEAALLRRKVRVAHAPPQRRIDLTSARRPSIGYTAQSSKACSTTKQRMCFLGKVGGG